MIIGTNQISYPQIKNFVGLPFQDVTFKKVFDIYKILTYSKYKIFGKIDNDLLNKFNDFGFNRVDLFHFFNALTPVKKPWVVTFETTVPRPDKYFTDGYRWMAGEYCKMLLPFSQRAYDFQMEVLDEFPQFREEISAKMKILKPSQHLSIFDAKDKVLNEKISFVFVGAAFYRKGGYEMLKAFEQLHKIYDNIELHIVSNFSDDGYCAKNIDPSIDYWCKKTISESSYVHHYKKLKNDEVIQLLLKSNFAILPSYSETFGYFLLEAMSCGCPVITSNLRPFDEIVSEKEGYIFDIDKISPQRDYIKIDDKNNYQQFSSFVTDAIIETVKRVMNDLPNYSVKVQNCIDVISQEYSPETRVAFLSTLYKSML